MWGGGGGGCRDGGGAGRKVWGRGRGAEGGWGARGERTVDWRRPVDTDPGSGLAAGRHGFGALIRVLSRTLIRVLSPHTRTGSGVCVGGSSLGARAGRAGDACAGSGPAGYARPGAAEGLVVAAALDLVPVAVGRCSGEGNLRRRRRRRRGRRAWRGTLFSHMGVHVCFGGQGWR